MPRIGDNGKPLKRLTPRGFSTGGRCHVARPSADAGTACWHTEAIHKANLTADRVGAVALGSFGVGNVRALLAGARAVDPRRRRLHVVALDADFHGSREEVALARRFRNRAITWRWPAGTGRRAMARTTPSSPAPP